MPAPAGCADRDRPVRPGLVLAVVLIGQFMAVLDASIVNVAAPSIHASLRASGAGLQLVVAGYTITYAVLLVTGARLGDIVGHRRVFLAGLVLFTLASLGCGLAGTAGLLIALRFAQGAGAALMIPQVLSLIQRTHAGPARARAMSRYSAVLAGGAVVGQLVGGLLISANLFGSSWRPVFLVNVPIGVALLAVGARALPPGKGEPGRTLDLAGLALLTPAVLALVLPLVLGQPEHWPLWGWGLMAASVPVVAAFVAAERRVAGAGGTPLIPGRVLRVPGVPVAIAALFTVMTIFSGFFFTLALHLQDGLGYSPLRAGLTFAPAAAAFALVSLNWRRLPARWHSALIVGGFAAFAAAMAGLAWVLRDGRDRGSGPVPDRRSQRRRDGGRVQPADDPRAAARPGRAGRGRDRGRGHGEPARLARRRGHVRHAIPEPGRAPARARHVRRIPARVSPRRGGHLPRPRGPGRRRRSPGDHPRNRASRRDRSCPASRRLMSASRRQRTVLGPGRAGLYRCPSGTAPSRSLG